MRQVLGDETKIIFYGSPMAETKSSKDTMQFLFVEKEEDSNDKASFYQRATCC